jgi:chromosome segregation ATPase
MMGNLTLSVFEIIFLFISAIVVGVVIHFFITSRRHLNKEMQETKKPGIGMDERRIKYLNEIEAKNKEFEEMKNRLFEAEENNKIYQIEIEEIKRQARKVNKDAESSDAAKPLPVPRPDYYEQLRQAQQSLEEHNEKISKLLEQVDVIKESEEKNLEILRSNKELNTQINDLKYLLEEKESEINQINEKASLTKEMTSMLDNAYSDFDILQTKIKKLESQLLSSNMANIEYEDLKEAYYKMARDLDESKNKANHYMQENQRLQIELATSIDKLSEANQQRQHLQKKVSYLEELTYDLQQMSEANKKLENQMKKIGELESMLNMVAEERDQLKEKQDSGV